MAGTGVVLMSCSFCNMMGAAGIDDRPRVEGKAVGAMVLTRYGAGESDIHIELDAMAVCGNAAISPVEYSVRNLVGFALELADLIEGNQYGGTCRNVYPNNEDHHCDNGFRCSACGDTVEDCENYRVSGTWNYCPKCRAKVVG